MKNTFLYGLGLAIGLAAWLVVTPIAIVTGERRRQSLEARRRLHDDKQRQALAFLRAELAALDQLIAECPPEHTLTSLSLMWRRADVAEELKRHAAPQSLGA